MSDAPEGPGWWLASDGKYYPPQPPTGSAPAPEQGWAPVEPAGPPRYVGGTPFGAPQPDRGWPAGPPTAPVGQLPPPEPPKRSGGAKVALIVGGLVVLVILLGLLGVAAVFATRDLASTASESGSSSNPAPSGQGSSGGAVGDADVVATEIGFSTGEGFDGAPSANAAAVLRNSGTTSASFFEVVFTFTDADGNTVGTETAYVDAIGPDGTAHAVVDAVPLQGTPTKVEAVAVIDEQGFWTGTQIPVEVTDVSTDDFFGLQVSGTATNPTDEPVQAASVQCVVRDGDTIVGGATATLDTIVPGGEVAWEAISFSDWLRGDIAECSGGTYG